MALSRDIDIKAALFHEAIMAKHISDFTKDSDSIVLDLINEQNGTALTADQIDTSVIGEANTKAGQLLVTSRTGSGYRGSVALNYNRIMLSELFGAVNPDNDLLELSGDLTVGEVIDIVNARCGVNLTAKDIYVNDMPLPDVSATAVNVEFDQETVLGLSADFLNPHVSVTGTPQLGKVWTGTHNLRLTKAAQLLADVWGVTLLDGLYPPGTGSASDWLGRWIYNGSYISTNAAISGFAGNVLASALQADVIAVNCVAGTEGTEFEPGYVDIVDQTSPNGNGWVKTQTITRNDNAVRFGAMVALSPDGNLLAVTSSTGGDGVDQHSINLYKRGDVGFGVEDEYVLFQAGIVPTEAAPGTYKIGGFDVNGITFVNNNTLAFAITDKGADEYNIYGLGIRTVTIDRSTWTATVVGAMSYAEIGGPRMTTLKVLRVGDNAVDLAVFSTEDKDVGASINSINVAADGSITNRTPSAGRNTIPMIYSKDGLRFIDKDGHLFESSTGGGGSYVHMGDALLNNDFPQALTGPIQNAGFNDDGTACFILANLEAKNGITTQSAIFECVFSDDGEHQVESVLLCPRLDEDTDREDILTTMVVAGYGQNIFATQPDFGEVEETGAFGVGVVHNWYTTRIG